MNQLEYRTTDPNNINMLEMSQQRDQLPEDYQHGSTDSEDKAQVTESENPANPHDFK